MSEITITTTQNTKYTRGEEFHSPWAEEENLTHEASRVEGGEGSEFLNLSIRLVSSLLLSTLGVKTGAMFPPRFFIMYWCRLACGDDCRQAYGFC